MKQRDVLLILGSLFVLTILWVFFNIYHSFVTSTIKDPITYQILPIESSFDTQTLEEIKDRTRVEPAFELQAQLSPIPSEIPQENTSTQSAQEEEE